MKKTIVFMILVTMISAVTAERIKDLASILGVRTNQLVGYGLVVGLHGTGDQSGQEFTVQSFRNMLTQMGINMPPGIQLSSKNIAAVMVTAQLDPFMKQGQLMDVTVSSIGSAKSLRGGTLLMTPLKGADGNVYGLAQGNLVVGGFDASGKDGSKITVNVPSVGRIPNGATIERTVATNFGKTRDIVFNLHTPDFTTAKRMVQAVNDILGQGVARALDAASICIKAPRRSTNRVSYVSMLENIQVRPAAASARVIINSRTGTVVIGQHVKVSPAAVTHGSLTVSISENIQVSQPNALPAGNTQVAVNNQVVTNQAAAATPTTGTATNTTTATAGTTQVFDSSTVTVKEDNKRTFLFNPGSSLRDIVKAVNAVGATPSDLVAILEALKEVGALHAELIVI